MLARPSSNAEEQPNRRGSPVGMAGNHLTGPRCWEEELRHVIDDKEFGPEGFFGQRGIKPEVARERRYVRFEFTGTDAVFEADPALEENAGFVHWLVCGTGLPHECGPGKIREKHGGYVIQKHPVPLTGMEHIVAQIRPETAPVTEITYHDHAGMKHQKGKCCPCGAGYHRKAYRQRTYNETEREAHESGSAHKDYPEFSTNGPHRHVEEGKYMLNPNRERRAVPHTHRIFLKAGVVYCEEVIRALVIDHGERRANKSHARELAVSEQVIEDHRDLARHVRRPVDHRFGGHGGTYSGGPDELHEHVKEVDYAVAEETRETKHRVFKEHGKPKGGHRDKDGTLVFDPYCRKCVAERHMTEEHPSGDDTEGAMHPHTYTQRVNLPSTEKRLDMHPRTRKQLGRGKPSRWFFSIEGTPKNDALVSAREAAFNVPSVTMWRAPELGDFAREYLTGLVYVVPDSDWASNPGVALQAFECREFLRGIVGQDFVHVVAAPPKCGDVCDHTGQERKNHKRGADDFLGEGFTPDDLIVLDRHLSYSFSEWAKDLESDTRGKPGRAHEAASRFLLENSLGAWWAARHPDSPLLGGFAYLRYTDEGTPAVGSFDGWPQTVAEVTVMDPCCGSGHFLAVAFEMLARMRMEEEGLDAAQAGDAVIADNLFGLELDPRCTQIAAFALALSAWKHGGYRELPDPNIACSGTPVKGQLKEWKKLAEGDKALENALVALHELFRNAPELGSLIDPRRATEEGHLFSVDFDEVAPLLEKLLEQEHDPEAQVAGWAAAGIAKAASLLARTYTLVATNVPYLVRRRQSALLRDFADFYFLEGRADIATMFLLRTESLVAARSTLALVSPQNWMYLKSFQGLRLYLLQSSSINFIAVLGLDAFESISSGFVDVSLTVLSRGKTEKQSMGSVDLSSRSSISEKKEGLQSDPVRVVDQEAQLLNPMARIQTRGASVDAYLSEHARSYAGIQTGDTPKYVRCFWEMADPDSRWVPIVSAPAAKEPFTGRHQVLCWDGGSGEMVEEPGCYVRGREAWGRRGVAMAQMGQLNATLYSGELFDQAAPVVVPHREENLGALWVFLSSQEFEPTLRESYAKSVVTPAAYSQVPFDLEHWTKVAEGLYPHGLPEPYSNDPTQSLFRGDLTDSTDPLQVAVARLLGYSWLDQEPDDVDTLADPDGIVCLPSVAGEKSAAERLRVLLEDAYGTAWSQSKLSELLTEAGSPDLETWLRDSLFAAHCKLFHNRPFIWHIWDGRKDGFSALVNYHRLDAKLLSRLTHTILGDWITEQKAQVKADTPGAEPRLAAALDLQARLELILEGEPLHDIYVRWKPLAQQPIGWDPDLNDGVRLNIRPFVEAKVLRSKFTIHWKKDRGKDPDGSERLNDLHLTRAEKDAAREKAESSG